MTLGRFKLFWLLKSVLGRLVGVPLLDGMPLELFSKEKKEH